MAKNPVNRSRARQVEDEELEHAYRGMTRTRQRKKKRVPITRNTTAVIAICAVLILLAIIILVAAFIISGNANGRIMDNVFVAGVDVGGMTQSEAVRAVRDAVGDSYQTTPMIVKVLDKEIQLPCDIVGELDIEEAVKEAHDYGRKGTAAERKKAKQTAASTGYVVDLTSYLHLDTDAIRNALDELGAAYSSTLSQTQYEVVGEKPTVNDLQNGKNLQTLVIKLGLPEYGLDMDALYQQVLDAYNSRKFYVEGFCGTIDPDSVNLQEILDGYYIAPVDAYLNADGKIVEGSWGYGFDIKEATAILQNAQYGSTVEIPFVSIAPEITAQSLEDSLFQDELATYTAVSDSDPDRDTNLRLACEAIDGLVLQPGDAFSYNNALGERTAERGYKPGPSYAGTQTVYTIGGGICQVSSALYYCVMVADLEILLRECHTFQPAYAPLGMDATVSWGTLDFRFRNNSDSPIRIVAKASGGTITVSIMGTDNKDYYVEMEYEIINEYPSTTTYKTMSANNPEGYKNGDYIVQPYKGYDIKTYRCKYSKDTKELISRTLEAVSDYRKRDGVICEIVDESGATVPDDNGNQGIGNGGVSDGSGSLPPE